MSMYVYHFRDDKIFMAIKGGKTNSNFFKLKNFTLRVGRLGFPLQKKIENFRIYYVVPFKDVVQNLQIKISEK